MMRLVLANAILGTALAWAVLHDRAPSVDAPAPVQAAAIPTTPPAAVPPMLPIVPVSVTAEPETLVASAEAELVPIAPEAPVAAAEAELVPPEALVAAAEPELAPEPPAAAIEAEPLGGAAGALPELSRAGRLAALDALAAEMERFALDRRR